MHHFLRSQYPVRITQREYCGVVRLATGMCSAYMGECMPAVLMPHLTRNSFLQLKGNYRSICALCLRSACDFIYVIKKKSLFGYYGNIFNRTCVLQQEVKIGQLRATSFISRMPSCLFQTACRWRLACISACMRVRVHAGVFMPGCVPRCVRHHGPRG